MSGKPTNIEEYLDGLDKNIQEALKNLQEAIKEILPAIEDGMGKQFPAIRYKGKNLVYYGASKKKCSLYLMVDKKYKEDLQGFETGKGVINFQPEKPLPRELLEKIILDAAGKIK